jgi:hypothetical protein
MGHVVVYLVEALYYKPSVIPDEVLGFFQSFKLRYSPGVNSASKRKKYQESFLQLRAASA